MSKSYVWDRYSAEPEEIEGILSEKSLTPVFYKIASQPFFGGLPNRKLFENPCDYINKCVEDQHRHFKRTFPEVTLVDMEKVKRNPMVMKDNSKFYENLIEEKTNEGY